MKREPQVSAALCATGRVPAPAWAGAALVFALALLVRLDAVPLGAPYHYAWDEGWYTSVPIRMATHGDPNPHFFAYPSLPGNLMAAADATWLAAGGAPGRTLPGSSEWTASERDQWNVAETQLSRLNRTVTAFAGALTCALLVPLAAAIGPAWVGVAAGALLALSAPHAQETAHAAVDPWAALFFLAAALPLVLCPGRSRAVVASAALAGLAASCKYNAGFAIVPALWLAWNARTGSGRPLLAVALACAAALVLTSPFLLLDPMNAAHGIAYEIRHYALAGHRGAEYGRGLGTFLFYARGCGQAVGPIAWLAPLGAAMLLAAPATRVVMFGPMGYLLLMSFQRVAFARNMDALLPWVALWSVVPIAWAVVRLRSGPAHGVARWCATAAVLAAIAGGAAGTLRARAAWHRPDSRTEAMRAVADEPGKGAVARSLHVHGEDLARAAGRWRLASADSVRADAAAGRIAWALLPADSGEGLPAGTQTRFGETPLASNPPNHPALVLWRDRSGSRFGNHPR